MVGDGIESREIDVMPIANIEGVIGGTDRDGLGFREREAGHDRHPSKTADMSFIYDSETESQAFGRKKVCQIEKTDLKVNLTGGRLPLVWSLSGIRRKRRKRTKIGGKSPDFTKI